MRRVINPAAGGGQFLFAGVTPEAEADGGTRFAVRQSDGAQDMARPPRATGAGRTERKGDIAHVRDQSRSIQTLSAKIEVAAIAVAYAAVNNPSLSECCQRYFR